MASLVRTALGGQAKQASTLIAGDMEIFLASDVIYSQRVAPLIQQTLAADGIQGQSTDAKPLPAQPRLARTDDRLRAPHRAAGELGPERQVAPGTPRQRAEGGERGDQHARSLNRR